MCGKGVGEGRCWALSSVAVAGPESLALVHCPPSGARTARDKQSGNDYGDFELAHIMRHGFRPPALVLSGHVHSRQRFHDRVGFSLSLNPGYAAGVPPNHIIIDLAVRTAEFAGSDEGPKWVSF